MKNLEKLISLFDSFHEAIYVVNTERKILYFNPAAEVISGFLKKEITNSFCFDNKLNHIDDRGNHLCTNGCPLLKSMEINSTVEAYVYLHHKLGHRVPVHVRSIPYTEDGVVVGAIEVFTSENRRDLGLAQLLAKKDFHYIDQLTGLYNRYFIEHSLNEMLVLSNNIHRALMFIDIDDFKEVNDTYGHLFGDQILKMISDTLLVNTRSDDFVIRFGGDEIIVVFKVDTIQGAVDYSERIRILITNSQLRNNNIAYSPSVSIGITMIKSGETFDLAINRADNAMYHVKKNGKNHVYSI